MAQAALSRQSLSRRQFLNLMAAASPSLFAPSILAAQATGAWAPPVIVFTKAYQVLNLNFEDSAAITAEAGLAGVDVPVRPKGEVDPERVEEDLPRYVEALRKRNLSMPHVTTAIVSPSSPHAEAVIRTTKKLGVQFYRIGFIEREPDAAKQIRQVRAQLKDLAAMNKSIGITALVQNHSPAGHTYLGGDVSELSGIVAGFDPEQIGVAFDIGHALIVHKDQWREQFEKIKPHLRMAYVKDAIKNGRWVPFGTGDVGKTNYFKLLKDMGYDAPISLHLEYDWQQGGQAKNRSTLLRALQESSKVLGEWLAKA